MTKNISKFFLLSITTLFSATLALNASAALFDTMESVDTLQKIADAKRINKDRMPAGKVTEAPAADTAKTDESASKKSND